MIIRNFTPHDINIIDPASTRIDSSMRKIVSDAPVVIRTISSSGMLSLQFKEVAGKPVDGIPVRIKVMTSIDPIPEGIEVAIVSALYAAGAKDIRCYTVIDPVYTPDGRTVLGCLAIGFTEF